MENTIEELTSKAEAFIREEGYNGLADHTLIKKWMGQFALDQSRKAVEAEKTRLLERYKSRTKRLRADDAETHRIEIQVKDERIAKLRAKNAALVEAAQLVIKRNWERINGDGSDYLLFGESIGNLDNAINANTEKEEAKI